MLEGIANRTGRGRCSTMEAITITGKIKCSTTEAIITTDRVKCKQVESIILTLGIDHSN